mmetsp:Transcript_21023/g.39972  ORF Transcript_21023/g.39972 Transcript_21023/m.39972 type:complete len:263 (-) Transcript_21023:3559-4347(-)
MYTGRGTASSPGTTGSGARAHCAMSMRSLSRDRSRPWSCFSVQCMGWPGRPRCFAGRSILDRSMSASLGLAATTSRLISSMSARPIMSFSFLKPSSAMIWRSSSAMKKKKLITCSGSPANFSRSSGSCVAMPTGQVFLWHLRIMMQPMVMRGAVAKPNSSAPSRAAIATSRPVLSCPSVCTTVRARRLLDMRVWWVSARPSSHGNPHPFTPVHLAAPVPPSCPEMSTWSALPLTTPEAITPTPASDTSLTLTLAAGLVFLRS